MAPSGSRDLSLSRACASAEPRFRLASSASCAAWRGAEHPWAAVAKVNGVTEIRNEYGDPAAEEFLRGTANLLRTSLRESDKLAPVGRGEYGIILDAPSGDDVVAGLERLVQNVRQLASRDRQWKAGSLIIGVAPVSADEPAAILARARAALHDATKRGGSLVVMSTDPP